MAIRHLIRVCRWDLWPGLISLLPRMSYFLLFLISESHRLGFLVRVFILQCRIHFPYVFWTILSRFRYSIVFFLCTLIRPHFVRQRDFRVGDTFPLVSSPSLGRIRTLIFFFFPLIYRVSLFSVSFSLLWNFKRGSFQGF